MNEWQPIKTAPKDEVVMTKIDDGHARNEQPLILHNRLWWFQDMSMYVYYTPTHWMPLTKETIL